MSECRFRRTLGSVRSLGLHLVGCPKYRRLIVGGHVARRCGQSLGHIAAEHDWEIVAKEVMPDHVHLFVRVAATDAPPQAMPAFKGCTARVLRSPFRHLLRFAKVLWSPSCFVASVGDVSEPVVHHYIGYPRDKVAL